MSGDVDVEHGEDVLRPPCPICREPYTSGDAARHIEPVDCDVCYRCKGQPACYRCGHMYCACPVHQA